MNCLQSELIPFDLTALTQNDPSLQRKTNIHGVFLEEKTLRKFTHHTVMASTLKLESC